MTPQIRQSLATFTFLIAATVSLAACVVNPVSLAETPAQKAYALSSAYNVLLEQAVVIIEDEQQPLELRRELQDMERRTTPVVEEFERAWAEYEAARATWEAAETSTAADRLETVTANFEVWIGRAQEVVNDLAIAVAGD